MGIWVSVDKRLPKKNQAVMVRLSDGSLTTGTYDKAEKKFKRNSGNIIDNVVYWATK